MPLPDAKPDRRIYELLKTTDLENLTFSDFQGVAEKVYAEQGAEDTLRRIVLVNLARLAVVGEWTGLTDAGGGNGYGVLQPETTTGAYDGFEIAAMAPWGTVRSSTSNLNVPNTPVAFPFVAPESGDLSEVEIWVNTTTAASTLVVGFYANDTTDNMPGTLLGYVTIDTATSSGSVSQNSFSSTVTLSEGTQYWCAYARGTTAYASIKSIDEDNRLGLGIASSPIESNNKIGYGSATWKTPTVPVDNIGTPNQYNSGDVATIVIKF